MSSEKHSREICGFRKVIRNSRSKCLYACWQLQMRDVRNYQQFSNIQRAEEYISTHADGSNNRLERTA